MNRRIAVLVVLAVASLSPVAAQPRWHATVAAPQAGLPDVDVELGYTDQYLPTVNTPATFHARSAERPFDGYIGYHLAAGNRQTRDVAVIARAELQPHSQWTFSTSIRFAVSTSHWDSYPNRELVLEWRDRDRNLLAQHNLGRLPWVQPVQPLRIVRSGETASGICFGDKAVMMPASSLSDQPQWYGGFSMVAVPISLWLELPRSVRAAIFHSALRVVFIGIPGRVPSEDIDRALLPIDVRPEPGVVEVPWPYHDGQARTIPGPVSWRAKQDADAIGSAASPYLVTNAVATFVADERALRDPLPLFRSDLRFRWPHLHRQPPTASEILRDYRPAILFTLLAALSIAAWFLVRRRPRISVLAAMIAVTLLAIGWRSAIRPAEGRHAYEQVTLTAPGIVDGFTTYEDAGPPPLRAATGDAVQAAASRVVGVTSRGGDDVEVRTSRTPPGFGDLFLAGRPWAAASRAIRRRDLGVLASIRIRSRDAEKLVLEYDSTIPVDYVTASWTWNDRPYYGEARAGSRRGVVTIPHQRLVWPRLARMSVYEDVPEGSIVNWRPGITLIHAERDRTTLIGLPPPRLSPMGPIFTMSATARRDERGDLSWMLLLPAAPFDQATVVLQRGRAELTADQDVRGVVLSGPGGVTRSQRIRRAPSSPDFINADFSGAELRRIAPGGGLINVSIETTAAAADISSASIELRARRVKR
jgi:hypothetical protein